MEVRDPTGKPLKVGDRITAYFDQGAYLRRHGCAGIDRETGESYTHRTGGRITAIVYQEIGTVYRTLIRFSEFGSGNSKTALLENVRKQYGQTRAEKDESNAELLKAARRARR